jgi:hypothetical protein
MRKHIHQTLSAGALGAVLLAGSAQATLVTDPNDPRNWQGATVGTFAALYFGSNTLANRQLVVNNQMLDNGIFNPTGFAPATLMPTAWTAGAGAGDMNGGGCKGTLLDLTGTGSYAYACNNAVGPHIFTHANSVDNLWFQTSSAIGDTVFDFGGQAAKAAIMNSIDHGPIPEEAIESTVYLSNDLVSWTQAVVQRVFLEGHMTNTGILWDGLTYIVGTANNATFRYASIIHGGPGALTDDGDDEINGVLGLTENFTPINVPAPGALALLGFGLLGLRLARRKT